MEACESNMKENMAVRESKIPLDERSLYLRRLVIEALDGGGRGHIGSSLSLIEILRVLYDDILNHDPENPKAENRDRFILSKGHGCLALYAILADKGYFPKSELRTFCHQHSILGGHPERGKIPGVEASTGALGHGLSVGLGMALAARIKGQGHRVFVALGDGEINEGSVWEAAMCAGKHQLEKLTVLVDYNKLQSYGETRIVQDLEPLADKWRSFNFSVSQVDGHDVRALGSVLTSLPMAQEKPSAIICHTVKGKGIAMAEHEPTWHHKSNLDADQIDSLFEGLGGRHAQDLSE
jgi:transketolase